MNIKVDSTLTMSTMNVIREGIEYLTKAATMDISKLIKEGIEYQTKAVTHFNNCHDKALVIVMTHQAIPYAIKTIALEIFQKRHGDNWHTKMLKISEKIKRTYHRLFENLKKFQPI